MFSLSLLSYFRRDFLAILLLGFSSGLPLALTASTLSAWLAESGVDKASIGLFAAVATPYALKFLWAPLIDGLRLPVFCAWFGRRRGWLFASQTSLAGSLLLLGVTDPSAAPGLTALMALLVAVCSATQDIVIDAYRVELLSAERQGMGAAVAVLGYRLGMIASTAGGLYLAAYMGWTAAYTGMAALIGLGVLGGILGGEPKKDMEAGGRNPEIMPLGKWLYHYAVAPLLDFMQRPGWLTIMLFIVLYRLADAFMGIMTNPFLLDIGFSKEQIANIVKLYGLAATLAGSFLGGLMVARLGVMRSLWICGVGHALANLMFIAQAQAGADPRLLALGITLENVTGGMGTAAFVAYISALTHVQFTATQYALLSSLAAFGRTWLATPAGWVAEKLGWTWFFTFAALLALPGLIVLRRLRAP